MANTYARKMVSRKTDVAAEHANARNNTEDNWCVPNARGKPEAFTPKENAAMRHVLRGQHEQLKQRHKGWTQERTGRLIGVSQQTAGKLLGSGAAGFSRPTALKLAELVGFDSPETMLRDLAASPDASDAPQGWSTRDIAVGVARQFRYDASVVDRVVAKYTESRYASLPARWWMERIVHEAAEQDAERLASAPTPAPPASEGAITEKDATGASGERSSRRKREAG